MTNNAQLMQAAKESLSGKWGLAIGTFFVYTLITSIGQANEEVAVYTSLITLIIVGPLSLGATIFSLNTSRDHDARFEQLFDGFKINFGKAIGTYLLTVLFTVLWMLLLIIPGIIAAISYSMSFFILAEDENIAPMDAIDKSKRMMYGYKWKYFGLGLRLFGLALLCILTLGIGFLWLIPYAYICNAKFYDDIKNHPIEKE